jgi:hypothetical protein
VGRESRIQDSESRMSVKAVGTAPFVRLRHGPAGFLFRVSN